MPRVLPISYTTRRVYKYHLARSSRPPPPRVRCTGQQRNRQATRRRPHLARARPEEPTPSIHGRRRRRSHSLSCAAAGHGDGGGLDVCCCGGGERVQDRAGEQRRQEAGASVGVRRLVRGHGQPGGPGPGAHPRLVRPLRPHLPAPPRRPLLRRPRPHRLRRQGAGHADPRGVQGPAPRVAPEARARHELRRRRRRRPRHRQLPAQHQRPDRPLPDHAQAAPKAKAPARLPRRRRQHRHRGDGARGRLRQRLRLRRRQGQRHQRGDRVHPYGGAGAPGAAAAAARRGRDAAGRGDQPAPDGVHAGLHPPARLRRLRPAGQRRRRAAQRGAGVGAGQARPGQRHLPPPRRPHPLRRRPPRRRRRQQHKVREPAAAVLRELQPGRVLRRAGRERDQAVHALRRPQTALLLGRRAPDAGRLGRRRRHLQGHRQELPLRLTRQWFWTTTRATAVTSTSTNQHHPLFSPLLILAKYKLCFTCNLPDLFCVSPFSRVYTA